MSMDYRIFGQLMKYTTSLILACCVALVGLHIWGYIQPSHDNWGVNFFTFFDTTVLWIAVFCVIIVSIPAVQSRILQILNTIFEKLSKLPILIVFLGVAILVWIGGTRYAAQLHLLGDGALLLRSLSNTVWGENILQSFNNQPLMYWIFRSAMNLHFIDSPLNTYDLYVWINRFAALLFLAVIFWCVTKLKLSLIEKVLVGCLLFFGAGSQFFFGYIENYVLQYVTTAAYVVTGWHALERRVSIIIPILCFCADVGLHLANLVLLPTVLVLVLLYFKDNRVRTILISSGIGTVGFGVVYYIGYLPALLRHFGSDSVDFLHLFEPGGGNFAYAMFSFMHLFDWFNLSIFNAPIGLAIALILLLTFPKEQRKQNPSLVFLIVSAVCGLLFTWIVNPSLGFARDWDLLAGFFLPLLVLDVYLLSQSRALERRVYVLVVIITVTIFHWVPWIGINTNEERHLQRVEMLHSSDFLSPTTLIFYDEALANFFFDRQRYAEAKKYYEHLIAIDPDNPRIIGNISDVYRKLGEKEKYFATLKLAVSFNTRDPGIYSNLGVEYASRGDTSKAIEFNLKALEIDPRQNKAHANLGILYTSKKNYQSAQQHFENAIQLGMRDPLLYKYAADLNFFLNNYTKAIQYYDAYLAANPGDKKMQFNRQRANEALKKTRPTE